MLVEGNAKEEEAREEAREAREDNVQESEERPSVQTGKWSPTLRKQEGG